MDSTSAAVDSIDSDTERLLRNYGCDLIQKAGILLQLDAVTIASAQTILHRYYFKRSLKHVDIRPGAASACFLATKLAENMRKALDVARVFDFLINEENGTLSTPVVHIDERLYKDILKIERDMLLQFGFRLDSLVSCPHRYVLQYVFALFRNLEEYSNINVNEVAQLAWCYLNDSMRSTLCCKLNPGVIAAGCIYMAATALGIQLSKELEWYTVFDARWSDILLVRDELEMLYKMGKPYYKSISGTNYGPSPLVQIKDENPCNVGSQKSMGDSTSNSNSKVTEESSRKRDRRAYSPSEQSGHRRGSGYDHNDRTIKSRNDRGGDFRHTGYSSSGRSHYRNRAEHYRRERDRSRERSYGRSSKYRDSRRHR